MIRHWEWPTRDEWARKSRTPYHDRFEDLNVSTDPRDYATKEEIAAEIERLRSVWRDLGRDMKRTDVQETPEEREERERFEAITKRPSPPRWQANLIERRQRINRAIKMLQAGQIPRTLHDGGFEPTWFEPRYEAALKTAEAVRRAEILATPIDDGAWEKELQRRVDIEKWFSRPPVWVQS